MFVLVSVVGGVLAAGLFVPTAGLAAETAKSSAIALNNLPEELKVEPISEASKVLMADGEVLTSFYDQNRKYVKLEDIAPVMQMAQVGIEDQRFYEHGALDLRGTLRALVRSASGTAQGGSTLTQQYVKLALLYDAAARNDTEAVAAANNRTVSRKILELRYAVALEKQLTKDQILERYLNMAYFGDRAYGVEAAAQHYFGVSAKDLSLPQAAMLAGLVRNPVTTDPVKHQKLAEERMRNVLDRLVDVNAEQPGAGITRAQADEAKKYTFDQSKVQKTPTRGCTGSKYPHLCDYVYQVLTRQTPSLGKTMDDRIDTLNRAGLTIQTEIDPRFQEAAQDAVSSVVAPTDPVNGIMNMIEPGTGLIKAMAQSKYALGADTAKGETYLNFSASNELQGTGGYQGGSTFKAFTITAALLKGYDPTEFRIDSPKAMEFKGEVFQGCKGPMKQLQSWEVTTSSEGYYNMYDGATHSSNTYFVQLEQQVGVCDVVKTAEALGLKRADGGGLVSGLLPDGEPVRGVPSGEDKTFTLGTTYVTPLSLASAYATLAARGKRCDPIILKSITDNEKHNYEVPSANCQQVIPAEIADRVNDILHGPFSSAGTAARARIPGYDLSGKTGTQTQAETILMNGYTPDLVGSAMITADKKHPQAIANREATRRATGSYTYPVQGLVVHGTDFPRGYTLTGSSGGEAGAMIWRPAMTKALALMGKRTQFVEPVDTTAGIAPADNPAMAKIPECRGMSLQGCQAVVTAAGFKTIVSQIYSSQYAAGRFLGTQETGYTYKGSRVTLLVSKGPQPTAQPTDVPGLPPGQQGNGIVGLPPGQTRTP